jgi:hypothetical protein
LFLATGIALSALVGWAWRVSGIEPASGENASVASPVRVESRSRTLSNRNSEGEVLIGDRVVIRVRTGAGGYSPGERANVMARRLGQLLSEDRTPSITTGRYRGEAVVLVNNELVATADRFHARANGTTPSRLAQTWATNIRRAINETRTPGVGSQLRPAGERLRSDDDRLRTDDRRLRPDEQIQFEERTSNKIVPILSAGNGIRVGAARVSGAASDVRQVVAVAQLEDEYRDIARVRVWVPVSSENVVRNIRRVNRVSVTGFADIRL